MIKPNSGVTIIGGGLAGSEAAWQLAQRGIRVVLHEMRPVRMTDAHVTESCAELVCSNSFPFGRCHHQRGRAAARRDAPPRLADHGERRTPIKVPAGGALAVDRDGFSAAVQQALEAHPLIEIRREEIAGLPPPDWQQVIVATGPLTSQALAESIRDLSGHDSLAFFDAIAPIVHRDSIDMNVAWFQSRYDKIGPGGGGPITSTAR